MKIIIDIDFAKLETGVARLVADRDTGKITITLDPVQVETEDRKRFVLRHELGHAVEYILTHWHKQVWNEAQDFVINEILKDHRITLTGDGKPGFERLAKTMDKLRRINT
jgi:hypothetical protein